MSDDMRADGQPEEKAAEVRVAGGQLEHDTLDPARVGQLEEMRRLVTEAHLRGRAAATPAPVPAREPRRNQGQVITLIVIAVVAALVIAGFVVVMWRLHKTGKQVRALEVEVLG